VYRYNLSFSGLTDYVVGTMLLAALIVVAIAG
jgi:hypothetical protein